MKKIFNKLSDKDDGRQHHYVLHLTAHAGVDYRVNPKDVDKPPYSQAVLFMNRIKDWAKSRGQEENLKAEALPVSSNNRPRLRVACPPSMIDEMQKSFPRKIAHVDEIPLPQPKRPWWKKMFGM